MTQTWFNKTCVARGELRECTRNLQDYADSCYMLGLDSLAGKLQSMAEVIYDAEDTLSVAIGQGVNEAWSAAQQSSLNMLGAALAGAGMVTAETLESIVGTEKENEG